MRGCPEDISDSRAPRLFSRSTSPRKSSTRRNQLTTCRTLWLALLVVLSLWGSDETASSELPLQADRILILKSERKLKLLHDGATLSWFWIALGRVPEGPKVASGDGRTPEGLYVIDGRDLHSYFHRSLYISYPNKSDLERAARLGVRPGGGIRIHGLPPGYGPVGPGKRMIDWTDGCIAVTNADMDEIWARVRIGTVVEIQP